MKMPSLTSPDNANLANHLEHVHLLLNLSEASPAGSGAKAEPAIDPLAQRTWTQPLQSSVNIDPRLFVGASATPPRRQDLRSLKPSRSPARSDSGVDISNASLPQDELLSHLCELYFEHLNIWCPILHRQTVQNMLNDPSARDEADNVLLHAIVAATLRFSNDIQLTEARMKFMHSTSKNIVLLYGMENCSLRALQALTILTQDRIGSSHGTPTLNLVALITRSAIRLGLHKEGDISFRTPHVTDHIAGVTLSPPPKTWLEAESRRRLFWMIYLLDRHGATATGADFGIDDDSISLRLPCHEEYFQSGQIVETRRFVPADIGIHPQSPDNLGSFAFCVDMAVLTTQVQAHLKRTPQNAVELEAWQAKSAHLDSLLANWKASIPTDMAKLSRLLSSTGGRTVDPMWVGLTCTYHTATINLHSAPSAASSSSPRPLQATESLVTLSRNVLSASMLATVGPAFFFAVFAAARVLLGQAQLNRRNGQRPPEALYFLLSTLKLVGRYWPIAQRYARVLEEDCEKGEAQ